MAVCIPFAMPIQTKSVSCARHESVENLTGIHKVGYLMRLFIKSPTSDERKSNFEIVPPSIYKSSEPLGETQKSIDKIQTKHLWLSFFIYNYEYSRKTVHITYHCLC